LQDYKLALTLLATTRGIPQLYYGSEIGMKGSKDAGDADIRRDFPGGWETDAQTAFYSEDNPLKKYQKGRSSDQEAYFQFTKKVLNWRKTKEVIHKGQMIQFVPQENCYVYFRVLEGQKVMVVINNNVAPTTLTLDRFREVLGNAGSGKEVLSGNPVYLNVPSMEVGAKTALIIEVQ
jgi:glycosidase